MNEYRFEQVMFEVELEAIRRDQILEELREAHEAGRVLLPPPSGTLRGRNFEAIVAELRREGFVIRKQWIREGGRRVRGLSLEQEPGEEQEYLP